MLVWEVAIALAFTLFMVVPVVLVLVLFAFFLLVMDAVDADWLASSTVASDWQPLRTLRGGVCSKVREGLAPRAGGACVG